MSGVGAGPSASWAVRGKPVSVKGIALGTPGTAGTQRLAPTQGEPRRDGWDDSARGGGTDAARMLPSSRSSRDHRGSALRPLPGSAFGFGEPEKRTAPEGGTCRSVDMFNFIINIITIGCSSRSPTCYFQLHSVHPSPHHSVFTFIIIPGKRFLFNFFLQEKIG